MQLAIPHAPRPVTLRQVPGAMRRVSIVALACLAGVLVVGLGSRLAVRWLTDDARFVAEAERIVGTVVRVDRPAKGASESSTLPVAVIYAFKGQHSATIDLETSLAEPLGKGAPISLLVRPDDPGRPRELGTAEARAGRSSLIMPIVGVAIVAAILVLIRELRRATRREVEPLRTGLLVWLTPDVPLPETKAPFSFAAHYFRDDVKQAVTANADGRRKPVTNGDKVLAAVAPREPTWVRVVDEEVARSLGWYR
ncbi:MAG: DUF3592 domain-containing protein [Myxococcales bacterium]|nr:DUF3592 domain-containing protein [Myxococcales bacterium]